MNFRICPLAPNVAFYCQLIDKSVQFTESSSLNFPRMHLCVGYLCLKSKEQLGDVNVMTHADI